MKRARDDDGFDSTKMMGGGGGGPQIDKELKKAALDYLEEVKKKFENNKEVYDQFLDIMKDFQSRLINTPGVIERVSDLFKGDRHLILGFNTFLPEGYKIPDNFQVSELPHMKRRREEAERKARAQSNKMAQAAQADKPPELEYAKKYVSTIRTRFESSPKTYQEFLNILQNYQEEQKSVKEVYQQVRILFRDHQDLLEEFAKFLPDPNATAEESRAMMAGGARKAPARGGGGASAKAAKRPRQRRTADAPSGKPKHKDELELMKQLKSHMTRRQWDDMLKVLNLYNAHIIAAPQLVQSVRELFSKQPELHDSFYHFLVMFCGSAAMFNTDGEKGDVDMGPSFMLRLDGRTPRPAISRDSVANEVLNSEVVYKNANCQHRVKPPLNDAQRAMNQVEDERYELDVLVANIASTVACLDPIMEEIGSLPQAVQRTFQIGDCLSPLQIRTIERLYGEKEGSDAGFMLVNALYESPGAVIPVVLERLKQRHKLITQVRSQLEDKWREVQGSHHMASLDVRSAKQLEQDAAAFASGSTLLEDAMLEADGAVYHYEGLSHPALALELMQALLPAPELAAVRKVWSEFLTPFLRLGEAPTERKPEGAENDPNLRVCHVLPEVAAVITLHQQLHHRMRAVHAAVSTAQGSSGAPPKLWEAYMAKLIDTAKGSTPAADFHEWCLKVVGPLAFEGFGIQALVQALARRCVALVSSSSWASLPGCWSTVQDKAALGESCLELSFNTASLQMSTTCLAKRESKRMAQEEAKKQAQPAAAVAAPAVGEAGRGPGAQPHPAMPGLTPIGLPTVGLPGAIGGAALAAMMPQQGLPGALGNRPPAGRGPSPVLKGLPQGFPHPGDIAALQVPGMPPLQMGLGAPALVTPAGMPPGSMAGLLLPGGAVLVPPAGMPGAVMPGIPPRPTGAAIPAALGPVAVGAVAPGESAPGGEVGMFLDNEVVMAANTEQQPLAPGSAPAPEGGMPGAQ